MKFNINKINSIMLAALTVCSGFALQSCEDEPDKFELTDGNPTIYYIRPADVAAKDSLLTSSYPEKQICIVGKNLTSIKQMYFNDQKVILNTSYITDKTMILTVPKEIPDAVTDKIYMINQKNDTTTYDFHVIVPAPAIGSMSCEYANAGDEVTINGSYFIDDPATPITVTLPDGQVVKDFTAKTRSSLTFTMPECSVSGPFTVTSVYGSDKSKFYYRDTRGLLFDFDGATGLGCHGWHDSTIKSDETSITGKFLQLGDGASTLTSDSWSEGTFSFEYWPGDWTTPISYTKGVSQKLTDLVDFTNFNNLAYKFEMYIPKSNPWSTCALQLIVAGVDKVGGAGAGVDVDGETCAGANNSYFQGDVLPRGIYRPWEATGSYDTGDKWVTVTMPIADFKYGVNGTTASGILTAKDFTSFELFVMGGGVAGTDCQPIIKIDNIRVVPIK